MKTYRRLSNLISARANCIKAGNLDWAEKHEAAIRAIEEALPYGSGFDSGTTISLIHSDPEKLVFYTAFHHMNENGMYDGWTDHTVTVKPSLMYGYRVGISGKNRNDIKVYIAEVFSDALEEEIE